MNYIIRCYTMGNMGISNQKFGLKLVCTERVCYSKYTLVILVSLRGKKMSIYT